MLEPRFALVDAELVLRELRAGIPAGSAEDTDRGALDKDGCVDHAERRSKGARHQKRTPAFKIGDLIQSGKVSRFHQTMNSTAISPPA